MVSASAAGPETCRPASPPPWPGSASRRRGPGSTIRVVSAVDLLASRLPAGTVSTDERVRRERAIDSWTLDLLRLVRGDELTQPDAVVFPAGTEEVAAVLAWAAETGTAVIPRGAGSGVCG